MANSTKLKLPFILFIASLLLSSTFASNSSSPSPAPQLPADDGITPSPPPSTPSPAPENSSPASPPFASPPAPPPDLAKNSPAPAPAPVPEGSTPAPASGGSEVPAPAPEESDVGKLSTGKETEDDDKGMSGGSKAGIAVGVMAAAAVVGLGGFVLKKRRENMRRAQYASAARREFLGDL